MYYANEKQNFIAQDRPNTKKYLLKVDFYSPLP